MAKKKTARKTRTVITGYLEKIGQKVFTDHKSVITEIIKGHQGIYSLYKNDRLYYVGLASNLKSRISHHLNNKHKGHWTHFSLYIIRKQDHIKEIESMILRIAYPKGNSVKGKLKSKDLRPLLKSKLKAEWEKQFSDIIGGNVKNTIKKSVAKKKTSKKDRPLKGVFMGGKVLYVTYKGKDYKSWLSSNGKIKYDGKFYDSPSMAGKAIVKRSCNGWSFWKYKDKNGKLVSISTKRK